MPLALVLANFHNVYYLRGWRWYIATALYMFCKTNIEHLPQYSFAPYPTMCYS